jgi:hypothetical protein
MTVFGTIVDQQQDTGSGDACGDEIQQRLSLALSESRLVANPIAIFDALPRFSRLLL